ncbi:hypothetical protein BDQ17DRAFT_1357252 [Cyathus striatus]|nr:hypothetical protein BDQ17DRAFT_1357252 [Cyathus striatus]
MNLSSPSTSSTSTMSVSTPTSSGSSTSPLTTPTSSTLSSTPILSDSSTNRTTASFTNPPSTTTVSSISTSTSSPSLLRLLSSNSSIGGYITSLNVHVHESSSSGWWDSSSTSSLPKILDLVRGVGKLKELKLIGSPRWSKYIRVCSWRGASSSLVSSLQAILSEGNLEKFTLEGFDFESVPRLQELFLQGGNVQNLDLNNVNVEQTFVPEHFPLPEIEFDEQGVELERIRPEELTLDLYYVEEGPGRGVQAWLLDSRCALDLSGLKVLKLVHVRRVGHVLPIVEGLELDVERLRVEFETNTFVLSDTLHPFTSLRILELKFSYQTGLEHAYIAHLIWTLSDGNGLERVLVEWVGEGRDFEFGDLLEEDSEDSTPSSATPTTATPTTATPTPYPPSPSPSPHSRLKALQMQFSPLDEALTSHCPSLRSVTLHITAYRAKNVDEEIVRRVLGCVMPGCVARGLLEVDFERG